MSMQRSESARSSRAQLPRVVVGMLVVLGFIWLALRDPIHAELAPLDAEVTPLPEARPSCRLTGSEALANARTLEQMAMARWERVPFALREAPRAVLQMAEAEACFEVAGDRGGRMRSAAKRRSYASEVERRFAHARLLLRAATRARPAQQTDRTEQAEQADARASRQVATLLALLERAPPSAQPYRAELTQLQRRYAAAAAELHSHAQARASTPTRSYEARR